MDTDPLILVCELLNREDVKYVVIGAYSMAMHGFVRATRDIDIMVKRPKENIEKTLKALKNLTWGIAGEIMPEEVLSKPFTIIGGQPRVDIITSSMGIDYGTIKNRILFIEVDNVKIPHVDIDTLIKLKRTGRKQDEADIEKLELIKRLKQEEGDG